MGKNIYVHTVIVESQISVPFLDYLARGEHVLKRFQHSTCRLIFIDIPDSHYLVPTVLPSFPAALNDKPPYSMQTKTRPFMSLPAANAVASKRCLTPLARNRVCIAFPPPPSATLSAQ